MNEISRKQANAGEVKVAYRFTLEGIMLEHLLDQQYPDQEIHSGKVYNLKIDHIEISVVYLEFTGDRDSIFVDDSEDDKYTYWLKSDGFGSFYDYE